MSQVQFICSIFAKSHQCTFHHMIVSLFQCRGQIVFAQHDRLPLLGRQSVQHTAVDILPLISMHLLYDQGPDCTNLRLLMLRFNDVYKLQSSPNILLMLQKIEVCLSFSILQLSTLHFAHTKHNVTFHQLIMDMGV